MHNLNPDDLIDEVAVIIVAAGAGKRLGSARPKALVGLAGEAMLSHSLRAFERHSAVDSIIVVVPEDWVGPVEVLIEDLGCDKVSSIEIGGASRAASVVAGLQAVADRRGTAVLVHDAARPRVPESLIDRVLAPLADGWDGVVPGLPVTDTIKVIGDDGAITTTLTRELLCAVQTPQACRASALHAALAALPEHQLAVITDDTQAIELAGGRVRMVVGDTRAAKITTADDLAAAERALQPPPTHIAVTQVVGSAAGIAAIAPELVADLDSDSEHPDDLVPLDDDDLAGADS
ncbi:MAG: 2-C-methyl-D-erythritol 4-phosphate cytidylyltransferase [Thermoleophilia bacterium]|nr:2-C-methyl-D-erythritol 4-phosphate cytidylyltransferase [Thermoleophilia bacterium]